MLHLRYYHYHHGLAPKIDQIHNVIVENGVSDAAYVAWEKLTDREREEHQSYLNVCFQQIQSILPTSA